MSADVHALLRLAISYDGCSADPADPEARERYLGLICAPCEPAWKRAQMAGMSGCGLVQLGLWRALGVRHPALERPYVVGAAFTDLTTIARACGALHGPDRAPQAGDVVLVGDGPDGGGPGHAWLALDDDPELVDAVEGGQRTPGGHQLIVGRRHTLQDGWDSAGALRRKIRWVLDGSAVLEQLS